MDKELAEAIAATARENVPRHPYGDSPDFYIVQATREEIAHNVADVLSRTIKGFQREIFLEACAL